MYDEDGWNPRAHAWRQRRRAERFMGFAIGTGFVTGLIVGAAAAVGGVGDVETDVLVQITSWVTAAFTGPIFLAGLVGYALTPPVTDDTPRVEWWHWLGGMTFVLVMILVIVGAASPMFE